MRITLETSDAFVELEYKGARVPARVWRGTTEGGVPLHAFVLALAVDNEADASLRSSAHYCTVGNGISISSRSNCRNRTGLLSATACSIDSRK